MKRTLLSLFVVLLSSIPCLPVLRVTQELTYQGKPVPISPIGPKRSGPRTSYAMISGIGDQLRETVRDREVWLDVWKRIHSPCGGRSPYPDLPPLPEIDFSREMVIVTGMGARPSSAYDIVIDGAYERNDRLEVTVRSVEDRKGCMALAVMTSPVDVVRLPKTELPVVFREIEVAPACK